jgi:hypothetical protein
MRGERDMKTPDTAERRTLSPRNLNFAELEAISGGFFFLGGYGFDDPPIKNGLSQRWVLARKSRRSEHFAAL